MITLTFSHNNRDYRFVAVVDNNVFGFKCNLAIRLSFKKKSHNLFNSQK